MKKIRSESGSTLIITLFVLIIFVMIGTLIMRLSVTNSKQINLTEADMQVVDLAEMGVVHYKSIFIENFDGILRSAIMDEIENIKSDNISRRNRKLPEISIESSTIFNRLNIPVNNFLPSQIQISVPYYVDSEKNNSYTINSHYTINNEYPRVLKIDFESYGKNLKDEAAIKGTIFIDIEELIDNNFNPGTQGITLVTKPTISISVLPPSVKECNFSRKLIDGCKYNQNITVSDGFSNTTAFIDGTFKLENDNNGLSKIYLYVTKELNFPNPKELDGSSIFVGEDAVFGHMNGGLNASTLYFNKNATFQNTNNGINNTSIYAGNNLQFGQTNSGINESKLSIQGNATFENMNKGIEYSTIYIKKDAIFQQINDGINDSTIYVEEGNATFQNMNKGITSAKIYVGKNLTTGQMNTGIDNSTIEVNGDFTTENMNNAITSSTILVKGNFSTGIMNSSVSSDSKICVGGTISGGLADHENGINVISNKNFPREYSEKCLGGNNSLPTLDDFKPTIADMFDFEYK